MAPIWVSLVEIRDLLSVSPRHYLAAEITCSPEKFFEIIVRDDRQDTMTIEELEQAKRVLGSPAEFFDRISLSPNLLILLEAYLSSADAVPIKAGDVEWNLKDTERAVEHYRNRLANSQKKMGWLWKAVSNEKPRMPKQRKTKEK
jgi:hypothetical protein